MTGQLQPGAGDLDERGRQQRAVRGGVAAPAAHRGGVSSVAQKAPSPDAAKNSSAMPNPPIAAASRVVDQQQQQQRVDADHHPVAGQAGQGGRDGRARTTVRTPCSQPVITA